MSDDISSLTLEALSVRLRERRISSEEATRACLAQVERWQPEINCYIDLAADDALEAAARADRDIAAGQWRGPLHGVPIAYKDMFARKGRRVSFGSKAQADFVATSDATVIERLEHAGAVLLGGLNMGEFAISPTGHNVHFGDCRNPWNRERITGGSSSGSGAATAARTVYAALGSDTGGSIRLPAAICGVSGIKPTNGLVSRNGCMPRSWSLDTVGPLARTVRDCALMLEAIAGHDPRDPTTFSGANGSFLAHADHDLRGVRVGFPASDAFWAVDEGLRALFADTLVALQGLGATIHDPRLPDVRRYYDPANLINKVEGVSIHRRALAASAGKRLSASALSRLEPGRHIPATHYLEAQRTRGPLLREFATACFSQVDVLLLPVMATHTPTIEASRYTESGTQPKLVAQMTGLTRWVNFLGLPALSCPCGFDADGMPVGFQLVGRPLSEALLVRVGAAYQRATRFHEAQPALAN